MTAVPKARLVLQDVMFVRRKLEDETGKIEWRLYWILSLVLLRAVGHVLHKVDGGQNPEVRIAANALHKSWKSGDEHIIFRDFIELERNSILKEYETVMSDGPVPIIAHLQSFDGFDTVRQFLLEENIYRPVTDGKFSGEDGRTLLDEAIEWWRTQLQTIDDSVAS